MKSLPVIPEIIPCSTCVATKQMNQSKFCTKQIVQDEAQLIPECFANIKNISQAERNFLMCPTFNLGIYSACRECPLSCPQNINPSKNSSLNETLNFLANLLNLDTTKKKEITNSIEKLNKPEFKEIYGSLEIISKNLGSALNGEMNVSEISRKIIELETRNLKKSLEQLTNDGKISREEIQQYNEEINKSTNIKKLQSLIGDLKMNYASKKN